MIENIRHLPRWQIVAQLKKRGVRQSDIAKRVGCSTSKVNDTISRMAPKNDLTEQVWKALEEMLNGGAA